MLLFNLCFYSLCVFFLFVFYSFKCLCCFYFQFMSFSYYVATSFCILRFIFHVCFLWKLLFFQLICNFPTYIFLYFGFIFVFLQLYAYVLFLFDKLCFLCCLFQLVYCQIIVNVYFLKLHVASQLVYVVCLLFLQRFFFYFLF